MNDGPQSPEEESHLREIEEGRVLDNLHLLELLFVKPPSHDIDNQTSDRMNAIVIEFTMPIQTGTQRGVVITYKTSTGEIMRIQSGSNFGDFSRLRTEMLEERKGETESRTILLHRPGNTPLPEQVDEAISGIETGPKTGTRRIMPERIDPTQPRMRGINELWGESQFVPSAKGDLTMLKTIRLFNNRHGLEK